jgi:hypothetical protein
MTRKEAKLDPRSLNEDKEDAQQIRLPPIPPHELNRFVCYEENDEMLFRLQACYLLWCILF